MLIILIFLWWISGLFSFLWFRRYEYQNDMKQRKLYPLCYTYKDPPRIWYSFTPLDLIKIFFISFLGQFVLLIVIIIIVTDFISSILDDDFMNTPLW
jgi:hypothetical protein